MSNTISISEFKSLISSMSPERTKDKAFGRFALKGHAEVCETVKIGDTVRFLELTENKSNDSIPAIGVDIVEAVLVGEREMVNDLIRLLMEKIAVYEQGKGNVFTAAQLSGEILRASNIINACIDGQIIRTILCGREDVEVLGSGYYELKNVEK